MTAQAIESVIQPSVNSMTANQTLPLLSGDSDLLMINQRIGIATALALLVGIVQVRDFNIKIKKVLNVN